MKTQRRHQAYHCFVPCWMASNNNTPLLVKEKCYSARLVSSLQEPITVNWSLSSFWIPLQFSWQVKWDRPKGRTQEGNTLINYTICNNALAWMVSAEEIIHRVIVSTLGIREAWGGRGGWTGRKYQTNCKKNPAETEFQHKRVTVETQMSELTHGVNYRHSAW